MERSASLVAWLVVCVVVTADAERSEVFTAKVDEFATNLGCGEIEKVPDALDRHLTECPVKPQHGILKDVIRLLPPLEGWSAAEHPAGEDEEPVTGICKEGLPGPGVAPAYGFQEG
jgi:hypothetical protein